jgi:hypothetical protein
MILVAPVLVERTNLATIIDFFACATAQELQFSQLVDIAFGRGANVAIGTHLVNLLFPWYCHEDSWCVVYQAVLFNVSRGKKSLTADFCQTDLRTLDVRHDRTLRRVNLKAELPTRPYRCFFSRRLSPANPLAAV